METTVAEVIGALAMGWLWLGMLTLACCKKKAAPGQNKSAIKGVLTPEAPKAFPGQPAPPPVVVAQPVPIRDTNYQAMDNIQPLAGGTPNPNPMPKMAANPHDPNYQTLANVADLPEDQRPAGSPAFSPGGSPAFSPAAPAVKKAAANPHDPNYQTLAGLDADILPEDEKKVAVKKAAANPHDPNYQTLAGLNDKDILPEDKPKAAGGAFKALGAAGAKKATANPRDPNYQTLAGINDKDLLPEDKPKAAGGVFKGFGAAGGKKATANPHDPNYQTLAGIKDKDLLPMDKPKAAGGGVFKGFGAVGAPAAKGGPGGKKAVANPRDPNYMTLAGLNDNILGPKDPKR